LHNPFFSTFLFPENKKQGLYFAAVSGCIQAPLLQSVVFD